MIPEAIGALTSIGSAAINAIKGREAKKRNDARLYGLEQDNKEWYDMKSAEDFTQRKGSQAAIGMQKDLLGKYFNQGRKAAAISGATPEQTALQQEAGMRSLSDTASNLGAQADAYQDSVDQQFRATKQQLTQQKIASDNAVAGEQAKAAGQAISAGLNLIGTGLNKPVKETA